VTLFLWAVIILYLIILIVSWVGWQKTPILDLKVIDESIFVSIIVAARNEDKNLPYLISDLKLQTYPKSLMEWIFVDDHSDNKIRSLTCFDNNQFENLIIIDLQKNQIGKKMALRAGVERSKGELLIFTDADCRLKPRWIESFVNQYVISKPAMIIGLVDYFDQKGFLSQFYRFDLMSLVVTGSGLASAGFPVMCNGANLAVRRNIYMKNIKSLRTEIASGDDIFLLHAVKKDKREVSEVMKLKESVVSTSSPSNLLEFLNQRTRWASKSGSYTDINTIFLAVVVLLVNLGLIGEFINGLITGNYNNVIYMFLIKTIADCFVIKAGLSFFGKIKSIILFPFFSVIYPFYFFSVFLLSLFGVSSWKGRMTKAG
jgi:cellulose synthase/poly-beta-1,6-N-acetylglucosamine synthase-like glycosyltransferase